MENEPILAICIYEYAHEWIIPGLIISRNNNVYLERSEERKYIFSE